MKNRKLKPKKKTPVQFTDEEAKNYIDIMGFELCAHFLSRLDPSQFDKVMEQISTLRGSYEKKAS